MSTRHAAALALIGWYLMVPPKASNGGLDPQAPLSKWKIDGVYDTARECDERYHRDLYLAEDWKRATGNTQVWKDVQEEQCIATDDPRLKEK
jgi:hypothetical protein